MSDITYVLHVSYASLLWYEANLTTNVNVSATEGWAAECMADEWECVCIVGKGGCARGYGL